MVFFLRQNVLRQRLKPGDIVIHPQAGDPDGGEQRQRYRQPDGEGFTVAPGVQPALHYPSQGTGRTGMPRHNHRCQNITVRHEALSPAAANTAI